MMSELCLGTPWRGASQLQGRHPPLVSPNFSSNRNASFDKIGAGKRERGLGKEIHCGKPGFCRLR